MVKVKPFKAIRPPKEKVKEVASLPYDVVDSEEARALAQDNPASYFHIDKAEIDLPSSLSPYDEKVYAKAKENLAHFLEKGWLKKEERPLYYLYELTMDGRSQTGVVATTSIEEYAQGKIKKHEFTRPQKELDRINHMKACDANTSPIFLTYRKQEAIQLLIQEWKDHHDPVYAFDSYHEVTHKVWLVDEPATIQKLEKLFEEVDALYIADGHHRTESAFKVGKEKRDSGEGSAESEYFLSVLFPDEELAIWEYNRVVNSELPASFIKEVEKNFVREKTEQKRPERPGQFHYYTEGEWWKCTVKKEALPDDPVEKLDVSLLQRFICEELFGIEDIRTDKRIDFVGGIRGPEELEKLVDSGEWTIAFSMYPTSIHELLEVADAGKSMPPKSTWFEPKLLSGLFLHDLETEKK